MVQNYHWDSNWDHFVRRWSCWLGPLSEHPTNCKTCWKYSYHPSNALATTQTSRPDIKSHMNKRNYVSNNLPMTFSLRLTFFPCWTSSHIWHVTFHWSKWAFTICIYRNILRIFSSHMSWEKLLPYDVRNVNACSELRLCILWGLFLQSHKKNHSYKSTAAGKSCFSWWRNAEWCKLNK